MRDIFDRTQLTFPSKKLDKRGRDLILCLSDQHLPISFLQLLPRHFCKYILLFFEASQKLCEKPPPRKSLIGKVVLLPAISYIHLTFFPQQSCLHLILIELNWNQGGSRVESGRIGPNSNLFRNWHGTSFELG